MDSENRTQLEAWTERLDRFQAADMTVAQFCQAEGVTQGSYYYWRRKLRGHAKKTSQNTLSKAVAKPHQAFLPVTLPSTPESAQAGPSASMTVEMPGGIRVRLEVPGGYPGGHS